MDHDGYGTCECCGATCTKVVVAFDAELRRRYFCLDCRDSGAAIAQMEEEAG